MADTPIWKGVFLETQMIVAVLTSLHDHRNDMPDVYTLAHMIPSQASLSGA